MGRGANLSPHFSALRALGSAPEHLFSFSCALCFFFPFLYYTPMRIGIWIESEFMILSMQLFSVAMAGVLAWRMPQRYPLETHPAMLCLGGLIVLSCLLLPFHKFMGASWFGPPETGIGIGLFLCTFVLIFVFYGALAEEKNTLIGLAILAAALLGLWILSVNKGLFPVKNIYTFNSFLAFVGVAAVGFMARVDMGWHKLTCALCALFLIAVSGNKTTLAGVVFLPVMLWILSRVPFVSERQMAALVVVLTPLVICTLEWAVASPDRLVTIWSRLLSQKIVFLAFLDNPWALLHGLGWGHFSELLFTYHEPITSNPALLKSMPDQVWDAYERSDFHNHNSFLETLSAQGLLGLFLHLGFLGCLMFYCAPPRTKEVFSFLFLYTLTSSNWFEMPTSVPFTALAFACVLAPRSSVKGSVPSRRQKTLFMTFFVVLSATFLTNLKTALEHDTAGTGRMEDALHAYFPSFLSSSYYADFSRGGAYLSKEIDTFIYASKVITHKRDVIDFTKRYLYFAESILRYRPKSARLVEAQKRLEALLFDDLKEESAFDAIRMKYPRRVLSQK